MSEPEFVPWSTEGAPKASRVPDVMPAIDAHLYERVRTIHCARNSASHACSGRVTLDRIGMTLQCPLCGDVRSVYPKREEPADAL